MSGETGSVARVGVVMAAYQNEAFIAESLDSLLGQTWTDWECVVVDDGSTDGTVEAVRPYLSDPRIRLVAQANAGSGAARNRGMRELSPEVTHVTFLDSDDVWLPDALAVLAARLADRPDAVGAYGLAEYSDRDGAPVALGEHPARQRDRRIRRGIRFTDVPVDADTTFEVLLVSGPIWPTAIALLRRDVLRDVGGFDPALRLQQDWELYLRMSRRGPFVPVDRQIAWYRQHGGNVTHRVVQRVTYQDAVRLKTWAAPANTPAQRREAVRVWRALAVRRVAHALTRVGAAVASGSPVAAGRALVGAAMLATDVLRPNPPAPDPRRVERTARTI
jgi:glycosyltransferase involved in cell wall biosynthesis